MRAPYTIPLIDLRAADAEAGADVRAAVLAVAESQAFVLGEPVLAIERTVAAICGAAHGVGVASGSDALVLALRAVGVGAGDRVVTTPFTFVATAEAIARVGAVPVFCDVERGTFNLSPRAVERRLAAGGVGGG